MRRWQKQSRYRSEKTLDDNARAPDHIQDKIPEPVSRLGELANNLWWCWHNDARVLFKMLDRTLWKQTTHRPVKMLCEMSAEQISQATSDPLFRRAYDGVMLSFDRDTKKGDQLWFPTRYPELMKRPIAYFSAEFGLHQSLPIYSGGLGILSGDHSKEASDLGLPFVGVGFMYPLGYFRQRIPSHGWQEAVYEPLITDEVPIRPVLDENGERLRVQVQLDTQIVHVQLWHVRVGCIHLYLMDTDVEQNAPWDRELSHRLYGGDQEMRIKQEIILGIGGVRALRALGVQPAVWHMNEGHSAFMVLERIRELVANDVSFDEAATAVRSTSVFTTHTPVPAGHDAFSFHLMDKYFWHYWDSLGLNREAFLALGEHQQEWGSAFNMTVLALHHADWCNAVSELHGEVSRRMWQSVWPDLPIEEVPIVSITNGVHLPTWIAGSLSRLLEKYLGKDWIEHHDDATLLTRVTDIPDEALWEVRLHLKRKLMGFIRERARRRRISREMDAEQVLTAGTFLEPEALTIGFARRFATYKRATLLFRDMERLKALLHDRYRPVQIVFAGKAHPADDPGKHLIQRIYTLAKDPDFGHRIAFVEDYDIHVAHYLVQGVDVWLNTPRRPYEASGTSGMKAALNGAPNLSVLDGWWAEGYNGFNGWAIEHADHSSLDVQDQVSAESLYRLLEEEVVPLYYQRDRDNVPRAWMQIVKEAIRTAASVFCMRRMVKEYTEKLYVPAARNAGAIDAEWEDAWKALSV
jgi:starch phosphorylase